MVPFLSDAIIQNQRWEILPELNWYVSPISFAFKCSFLLFIR